MSLTRRALAKSAFATAAFAALPGHAKAPPVVIAHRGASGERPEHTAMAYRLAIEEGADFIEPDLVLSKDGHLIVRHEHEISETTDVAARPEFADRRKDRMVDGERRDGWYAEDFTLAELKTLRTRERLPKLRPGSAAFDGRETLLTFQEVVDLARAESRRTGRTIGVYPEMKGAARYAAAGLPMEPRLAHALKANGLDGRDAPVFVQCFEVGPLKTFMGLSKARRIQLIDNEDGPSDQPGVRYADMVSPAALKTIATYADGIGPHWSLVLPVGDDGGLAPPTALTADAHAVGLAVHPWTVRAENAFLPPKLRRGGTEADHGDAQALLRGLYAAGVDGVFSDFPALAVAARQA